MRDEIGSEFWGRTCEKAGLPVWQNYKGDKRFYMSGRTALYGVIEDIIENRKCTTAYLPEYCCHTMIVPFLMHGIQVEFYPVVADGGLTSIIDKGYQCDIVLTTDFFGYQGNACILPDAVHIHDVTHSLCQNQHIISLTIHMGVSVNGDQLRAPDLPVNMQGFFPGKKICRSIPHIWN